jgi:hypothetical protein
MAKKSFIKDLENLLDGTPAEKVEKVSASIEQTKSAEMVKKPKTNRRKNSPVDTIEVKLGEKLNIDTAEKLKETMLKNLKSSDCLKFYSTNCESIDITFIQLIYSLGKMAEMNNKKIDIEIPIREEQKELLIKAGINRNTIFSMKKNTISVNIGNTN